MLSCCIYEHFCYSRTPLFRTLLIQQHSSGRLPPRQQSRSCRASPRRRAPRSLYAGGTAGPAAAAAHPQRARREAGPEQGAGAAGLALTLSESRSGSAWQRRKRKDLGSLQSVCRVVRKQVPPTFSRTHLPGPAPGSGAELHRRQGPPAPRPPAGDTGNSQWFSAAILATAGRGRPGCRAPGAPPTGSVGGNSALPLLARRPSGSGLGPGSGAGGCDRAAAGPEAAGPARVPHSPRPTAEGRGGGRANPTCLYYRLPSISEIRHPVTNYTSTAQRSVENRTNIKL